MNRLCRRIAHVLAGPLAALVLSACAAPTELVAQWKAPDAAGERLGAVLVLATVEDTTSRRLLEDRMVSALSTRGVTAQPSYPLLPDAGPASEAAVARAISASGADSVLFVSPGKVSSETVVSPGAVIPPPMVIGPPGFYGHYRGLWAPTYIPPTAFTVKSMMSETRLVDARSKALRWSASTRTDLTEQRLDTLATQYAALIVEALVKDGLVR
jgi:hypothetical protein